MKYLLVVAVVAVVLWLMFGRAGGRGRRDAAARTAARPGSEDMVRCAHCGVHLPRSEALVAAGRSYCSVAHRDAGAAPDA